MIPRHRRPDACPTAVSAWLAGDPEREVRRSPPACRPSSRNMLANDPEPEVRAVVAERVPCLALAAALLQDPEWWFACRCEQRPAGVLEPLLDPEGNP